MVEKLAMDDISSSNIHEDVIIFSTRRVNAWNATIRSGSVIILGGTRETLQDVLNHKLALALKTKEATKDDGEIHTGEDNGNTTPSILDPLSSPTPSITDEFEIVTDVKAGRIVKV